MAQGLDPQTINPIITSFIEDKISKQGGLAASQPFETAVKPAEEYQGRMRVNAAGTFDIAVYVAAITFYATAADMQTRKSPKGALVLYLDTEIADKIFKAAGLQVPYDEDDESMMGLTSQLCQSVADALKDRLATDGYSALVPSVPIVQRNTIGTGIEFSKDQKEKQQISFYYLKHKAMVIEWAMGPLARK